MTECPSLLIGFRQLKASSSAGWNWVVSPWTAQWNAPEVWIEVVSMCVRCVLYDKPEVCFNCSLYFQPALWFSTSFRYPHAGSVNWPCSEQSVDVLQGWTRASVVMTFLIAASELDLSDAESQEKLKPLHKVLDKAWMIPCHATLCRFRMFFVFFAQLLFEINQVAQPSSSS